MPGKAIRQRMKTDKRMGSGQRQRYPFIRLAGGHPLPIINYDIKYRMGDELEPADEC
jgi:hypothetical protein